MEKYERTTNMNMETLWLHVLLKAITRVGKGSKHLLSDRTVEVLREAWKLCNQDLKRYWANKQSEGAKE